MATTLAQRVVDGVKQRILSGELAAGDRLPSESELVEAYAVSRTVVREAVTRLRGEGLVETFQGRGSFVLAVPEPTPFSLGSAAPRSRADVLDVVDLRIGVESEAAALAAARLTPASAQAVRAAQQAFASAAPEDAVRADFAFHAAVARASGNRLYQQLLDSLGPMMIMLPRTGLGERHSHTDAEHAARVRREHDAVAEAVLAGDGETARAAMRVHLGSTRRRLLGG